MTAIDVIVNRNAHRLSPGSGVRTALLHAAVKGHARVHETSTLAELARTADGIAGRGTAAVVLAGGDGSHMAGVTALWRAFGGAPLPVALAAGGTVCTVARNLGMRGGSRAWTERVLAAVCAGTARVATQPTLRVRDGDGGDRVGFIFGAGLVGRFFEAYYGAPRQGLASAARIAARVFVGSFVGSPFARRVLDPTACALAVDGATQPCRRWSLVLASVVKDLGLHLHATYRAGARLDRFHVVASGLPPRELGPQMPRVLAGRALRGEPHVDVLAGSLRVDFDARPGAYVLDGDLLGAGNVTVEAGPSLRLLVPSEV